MGSASHYWVCGNCDTPNSSGVSTCRACGFSQDGHPPGPYFRPPETAPQAPPEPGRSTGSATQPTAACPRCGTPVADHGSPCPRCGYVTALSGVTAPTATAPRSTPRWPIALGAVLVIAVVAVAGLVWLSSESPNPQSAAAGTVASPEATNGTGPGSANTASPPEAMPTPSPLPGDWTQADVDSARAALSAFTERTDVCEDSEIGNGDFWEEITWSNGFPVDDALDMGRRSEFVRGLNPIVGRLEAFQATPGGQLLQPDVGTLAHILATISDGLASATTEAEFDLQIKELAKTHAVLCEDWAMTFADGTSVGLWQRIEAMQDAVDRSLSSGEGEKLRVEFAVYQGPGDGYYYTTTGDGCTASAGPPMGAYSDLYPAKEVEVLDATGTVLDKAVLGTGTLEYQDGIQACVFDVTFAGLPSVDGYQVGFEYRGHYRVSRSELDGAGWSLRIPMGRPYAWSAPDPPPGGTVTGGVTFYNKGLEDAIEAMVFSQQNPGVPNPYESPVDTVEVTDRGFHVADRCQGKGAYSDLAPGYTITLLNEKAEVVSTAGLQAGWPSETAGTWGGCRMEFNLPNVPDAATYTIQTGRGSLTYTREDLASNGWNIELTLGASE